MHRSLDLHYAGLLGPGSVQGFGPMGFHTLVRGLFRLAMSQDGHEPRRKPGASRLMRCLASSSGTSDAARPFRFARCYLLISNLSIVSMEHGARMRMTSFSGGGRWVMGDGRWAMV